MAVILRTTALDANQAGERTLREVAARRSLGHATRRRRMPRQRYPQMIEFDYASAIRGVLGRAYAAAKPVLAELPAILLASIAARAAPHDRADAGEARRAKALVDAARQKMEDAVSPHEIESIARRFGERTSAHQREQLGRQVRAALGVDVVGRDKKIPEILDGFVGENVTLIESIPGKFAEDMAKMVTRAVTEGTRHEDLAADIQDRFDVSENHASLIARDQIGKVYGQVNASRQQDLGITRFVWRATKDDRLRPEHDEIDGDEFDYPDGHPIEGLPGEPIQCRCYAEMIVDELLAELDDDS